jgi:hypothetical protein
LNFAPNTIRLIAIVGLLGAIGIVLPALTGILPWLTPLAAVGLTADQVGAALTHGRRGEYRMIGINAILVAMAVRILMVL